MCLQSVRVISADVCSETLQDDLQAELSGEQPVDVLINSAGTTHTSSFLDTTPQDFEASQTTHNFILQL